MRMVSEVWLFSFEDANTLIQIRLASGAKTFVYTFDWRRDARKKGEKRGRDKQRPSRRPNEVMKWKYLSIFAEMKKTSEFLTSLEGMNVDRCDLSLSFVFASNYSICRVQLSISASLRYFHYNWERQQQQQRIPSCYRFLFLLTCLVILENFEKKKDEKMHQYWIDARGGEEGLKFDLRLCCENEELNWILFFYNPHVVDKNKMTYHP